MAVTGVNYSSAATSSTGASTTKTNNELGKDDFLQLLVTQLQHQDPLAPMEDKEFISQMAQFTSLEQMKNMNTAVQITQATSYIGKQVTWPDDVGVLQNGIVSSVQIISGVPNLVIDSKTIALSKVINVTNAPVATTPTTPTTPTTTGA